MNLETLIILLVILWALGFFAYPVGGSLIHVLLVVALVILVLRLLRGERL